MLQMKVVIVLFGQYVAKTAAVQNIFKVRVNQKMLLTFILVLLYQCLSWNAQSQTLKTQADDKLLLCYGWILKYNLNKKKNHSLLNYNPNSISHILQYVYCRFAHCYMDAEVIYCAALIRMIMYFQRKLSIK